MKLSKKGAKIALTYFITIIASLVIIGGAAFIVLSKVMAEDDPGKPQRLGILTEQFM